MKQVAGSSPEMKKRVLVRTFPFFLTALALLISGCGSGPILRPAITRPDSEHKPSAAEQESGRQAPPPGDTLDFSYAFADTNTTDLPPGTGGNGPFISSPGSLTTPSTTIRVALKRNVSEVSVYSVDKLSVHTRKSPRPTPLNGSFRVRAGSGSSHAYIVTAQRKKGEIALPCTLRTKGDYSFFELDEGSYRGFLVIHSETKGRISVVNHLAMEDYLRGVVLLEIGKRPEEEQAAVKAQAVAARTYSYKRLSARQPYIFDVLPTVADQVYGGVNAESRLTDEAIAQTEDLVLTHADTLINAYYHSTCGGVTANVADVWGKEPMPYLVPIRDESPAGIPYCAISRYFEWTETWQLPILSRIVSEYYPRVSPNSPCRGQLRGIEVSKRFDCGRVKSLTLNTTRGTCTCGGDKVRFVLRRDSRDHPILRSANFTIRSNQHGQMSFEGKGYGHGVGMCQMGAVGRAREGQTFNQILLAYYRGTALRKIARSR